MELDQVLRSIKNTGRDGMTKTAAAKTNSQQPAAKNAPASAKVDAARTKLASALTDALTPAAPVTKTAAQTSSVTDELTKMASALATGDAAALQKEAALYGAAVADGFMARLAQYEQAVAQMPATKVASDGTPTQEAFEKFAAENPELVKQAIALGYRDGKAHIEQLKQAGALPSQPQTDLQKVAAAIESGSADALAQELEKMAQTPEGQAKLAEIKRGYDETNAELTKMANDVYARGYADTIKILQAM